MKKFSSFLFQNFPLTLSPQLLNPINPPPSNPSLNLPSSPFTKLMAEICKMLYICYKTNKVFVTRALDKQYAYSTHGQTHRTDRHRERQYTWIIYITHHCFSVYSRCLLEKGRQFVLGCKYSRISYILDVGHLNNGPLP